MKKPIAALILGYSLAAIGTPVRAADPIPDVTTGLPPAEVAGPPRADFVESVQNRVGPFAYGEYILVQPRRDNLSIGALGSIANNSFSGSNESLHYQLTSGFRVGLGYLLPCDGWDVTGSFAYFHSRFQRTIDAPAGSMIFPALGLIGMAADSADGDAALTFSVTDVDIGRTYSPSEMLSVRIFGGGRFARINQSLKTIYSGGDLGDAEDYVNSPVRFLAGGLSLGSEANWRFFRGFGLYGKARFSLLAGQFDSTFSETIGGAAFVDISDRFMAVIPVAELGVGLSYTSRHFFGSVGYDLADWFNMVNGITVPETGRLGIVNRTRGDITLEGLSIKVGIVY